MEKLAVRKSSSASGKLQATRRRSDRLEEEVVEGLQEDVVPEHEHEGLGDLVQALLDEADDVREVPMMESG